MLSRFAGAESQVPPIHSHSCLSGIQENPKVPRYNPAEIEPKWQRYWDENNVFATPDKVVGEKMYVLDMFPYPSGDGLHVGHPEGYTATDIVCRYKRMKGVSVLHPMGFDAFGLPAEEHAIRTNTPPRQSTEANIRNFVRQLKMLGFSYDWNRQLATTDVGYFRWTQWIFLVLFDTWFDREQQKGRPIAELPIPNEVAAKGDEAIRRFRDEHRLAYEAEALVNWCPALGTVLANEEVIDGRSERGEHPVQRIPLRQWMLRITAYADRLEQDLESLDWPTGIKKLQSDWVGRSVGAEVDFFCSESGNLASWQKSRAGKLFPAAPGDQAIRVFTTRPDTLFGATYMVLAPEHPLIDRLTTDSQRAEVEKYREASAIRSDRDRTDDRRKKTGVFTGSHAINPVNGSPIPVWIADYVLATYGTGAIMSVPAHDTRDHEFAKQFGLEIVQVVQPTGKKKAEDCFVGEGVAINSGHFDGMSTAEMKREIIAELEKNGLGRAAVNYKLRDWLFSRQRFWGEPFPILHELGPDGKRNGMMRAVPDDQLPVDLPDLEDFRPHGRAEPPLEKAPDTWLYPVIDGKKYKRETNTMPQWAGSCWYFLRFIDPQNEKCFVDPELERQWMPVDLYIGGAEHAVLHLLYSRFWHKVLYDRGHVSTKEPFRRLVNQGMILGEMEFTGYRDAEEHWVSSDEVDDSDSQNLKHQKTKKAVQAIRLEPGQAEKQDDRFVLASDPTIRINSRAYKMSKSRGNVVNPDEIVADYGADSLRLYEMFMGPLESQKPWSMSDVNGVRKFLDRFWRMIVEYQEDEVQLHSAVKDVEPSEEQKRVLHKTIRAVSADIESLSLNTAIARLMEFVNFFTREEARPKSVMEQAVLLLSPLAPHISEELWQILGHDRTLAHEPWPEFDEALAIDQTIEIPVQILGKVRGRIMVARGTSEEDLKTMAMAEPKIAELIQGKQIRKVIVVPDRLVNIVAN